MNTTTTTTTPTTTTPPPAPAPRRLEAHPMYTPSDLAYFRGKGYDDAAILAFWDRDWAAGLGPVYHRPPRA